MVWKNQETCESWLVLDFELVGIQKFELKILRSRAAIMDLLITLKYKNFFFLILYLEEFQPIK